MRRKSNVYKRVEDMSEDKEGLRGSGGLRQRVGASAEKEPLLPSRGDSSQMAGCCVAQCQAPVQAVLRPGVWLPGVKKLHDFEEEWEIAASLEKCMETFEAAVESLSEAEHLQLRKVCKETYFIQVFAFTAGCNWLDIVEVHFSPGQDSSVTTARARSFSSGFLPACIPLAFIWNVILFWVPFSGNGFNTKRIKVLREKMQLPITVTSEKTCSCLPP